MPKKGGIKAIPKFSLKAREASKSQVTPKKEKVKKNYDSVSLWFKKKIF